MFCVPAVNLLDFRCCSVAFELRIIRFKMLHV